MGFFQDLKEDLSMAVNELIPEVDEELDNPEETVTEEIVTQEIPAEEPAAEEVVEVNEDIFRAAVDRLDETADVFTAEEPEEKPVSAEAVTAEPTAEPAAEAEEAVLDETVNASVEEELLKQQEEPEIAPDDLIKEVCDEIENAGEETELEKEVSKIMTQQNETDLTGEVMDETAIVTAGMKEVGDISSQGSLDVLGSIKGNIEILGKLNISGNVDGNSLAAEVFADSANITGDIQAKGSVKVGQSSVIIGNIYATSAVIAGAVKGDIDVQGPVVLDTSAIVMGNIKSKSVQINNGAVIEGMCSQCYAEVNPASFFQGLNK